MRNENFYTVIKVDNGDDINQVTNLLRCLSANAQVSGDHITVFCQDIAGSRIGKIKALCHRYKIAQTA